MSASQSDSIHTILEVHANLDLGEDDIALPYIVTIDYDMQQVLAIRRNWKEDDTLKRKRTYFNTTSKPTQKYEIYTSID
jgi:hypothetical protein